MSSWLERGGTCMWLRLLILIFGMSILKSSSRNELNSAFSHLSFRRSTATADRSWIEVSLPAKGRKGARKGGRSGRRDVPCVENGSISDRNTAGPSDAQILQQPRSKRKCWVRLEQSKSSLPIDICLVEIDDASWWEQETNLNPFGARAWPPALAAAKFLANHIDRNSGSKHHVVEVGCGTGLVALTAAACGATAVATDISTVVLSLASEGWAETSLRLRQAGSPMGTFKVSSFDLLSKNALPLLDTCSDPVDSSFESDSDLDAADSAPQCILVASTVLYEKSLGAAMAKRVVEACDKGAWVILADDDTGLREGGRTTFEAEWHRLAKIHEKKSGKIFRSQWTYETVKQKDVFGWAEKKVQLLHINHPPFPPL